MINWIKKLFTKEGNTESPKFIRHNGTKYEVCTSVDRLYCGNEPTAIKGYTYSKAIKLFEEAFLLNSMLTYPDSLLESLRFEFINEGGRKRISYYIPTKLLDAYEEYVRDIIKFEKEQKREIINRNRKLN